MKRYFFHFREGAYLHADDLGLEAASAEQAYLKAVAAARSMYPELLEARTDPRSCAFEITDEEGASLFHVPFTELLDACQPSSRKRHAERTPMAAELMRSIARAEGATHDLRHEFDQVRRSLSEASELLKELSRFTRPANRL